MIDWTEEFNADTDGVVVVRGMPAAVYHALDRLNASKVAKFASSMAEGVYGLSETVEPSMDMKLGTAVHTRLLEPADWHRAVEYDDIGPASKAKMAEREEQNPAQIVLARGWTERIEGIRGAVIRNEFANEVVFGRIGREAIKEVVILWTEQVRGVPVRCKARIDYWHAGTRQVMDIKTTGDASLFAFERKIPDLGYHIKGAWYCRAVMRAGLCLEGFPRMVWIVLSNDAPFICQPVMASGDMIEQGMAEAGLGVRRWLAHRENKPDPYPPPALATVDIAPWHRVPEGSLAAFELEGIEA